MSRKGAEKNTSFWFQIQPRSSRTEIVGFYGDAIKIRLNAPPVDGKANRELVRFLSETIGIPKSSIRIVCGQSGRRKLLEMTGVDNSEAIEAMGLR